MRIPSGVTDQHVYFMAVDATDLVTPETGLTSFTVYRSRDGGAATAYTTPTITEVSSANMPGVYKLLVDEDTTLAGGNGCEMMALYITHAGMKPEYLQIEIYRSVVTPGGTLTISGGLISGSTAIASVSGAVGSVTADVTPAAASVRAAVGLASANLDTQLMAIDDYLDTEVAAIKAKTDNLPGDPADASDIAASFSAVNSTLATIGGYIDTEVAAIKAKTDLIPASPAAVGDIPTAAENASAAWAEVIESGFTATQVLRLLAAYAAGDATGLNSTAEFTGLDGTTVRIEGSVVGATRTITGLNVV